MAKQTWNVDRKKGGTFSFKLDAQGNYTLQKDGFGSVKTLNLPELKAEDTKTTTTQDTKKISDQTQKAFGDVQPFYYRGGGADSNEQYINEYKIKKDKSLDTDTEPTGAWDRGRWGPKPETRGPWDEGQWGPQPSRIFRSDTEKFKTRFDPTQIKAAAEKPKAAEVVTTQLKKVNTALGPLAKAVGFVMNPVKGLVGAAVGMVTETPTQKHAKKYFNADDQTGRISGNPATDLYAGMNRVSAMGNLERAGERRIETREKTIEKKGYGPGDKFYDDTQKMKDQQKNYKDSKDNEPSINPSKAATVSRTNKDYGQFGRRQQHTAAGGGNGGGGGGRVICTELHRTHELSTKDWIRDVHFTFNTLTENHIKGYLIWAIPTVKHMKKYPKYRKIWKHIAQHRANDIAWRLNEGKFDLLGRIYAGIGEPLCWLIGNFTGNKQINELNIKNWRKA